MSDSKQSVPTGSTADLLFKQDFSPIGPIPSPSKDGNYQPLSPEMQQRLPLFLRQFSKNNIFMGPAEMNAPSAIAHVQMMSPHIIQVDEPNAFNAGVLAHEATHVWQNTRDMELRRGGYNYGDVDGLEKALKKGMTINNFSDEAQASMIEDFYRINIATQDIAKQQGGYLSPEQAKFYERYKAAYEPFIRQLVGMSPYEYDPKTPSKQPPPDNPSPPGLPPAEIMGFVETSKFMGGIGPIPIRKFPSKK